MADEQLGCWIFCHGVVGFVSKFGGNWTNFDVSAPFLMGRGGVVSVRERCPRWCRVRHPCHIRYPPVCCPSISAARLYPSLPPVCCHLGSPSIFFFAVRTPRQPFIHSLHAYLGTPSIYTHVHLWQCFPYLESNTLHQLSLGNLCSCGPGSHRDRRWSGLFLML